MMLVIVFAVHTCPVIAKKGPPEFGKYGHGCWERTDEKGILLRWCFQDGNVVKGEAYSRMEGFVRDGVFEVGLDKIVILGFPGNGWPARDYVENCRYHFEEDGRILVLEGCSTNGKWNKSESE